MPQKLFQLTHVFLSDEAVTHIMGNVNGGVILEKLKLYKARASSIVFPIHIFLHFAFHILLRFHYLRSYLTSSCAHFQSFAGLELILVLTLYLQTCTQLTQH